MRLESNLSLGQFLRQEREKRGITLEQVSSATKIGVRTLHALEGDQFSDLPAKPFIRGFVTSYARFIGLDYKEVLTHYAGFLEEKVQERPNREAGHSGYAFEKKDGEQSRTILGITMGTFIVVGGIAFAILKPQLHKHKHSSIEKLRAGQPSPSPSALVVAAVSPMPSGSASPSPVPSVSAIVAEPKVSATPAPQATMAEAIATPTPAATSTPVAEATPSPTPTIADPLNSGVGLKGSEIVHRAVFKALESVWVRYQVDDRPMMQFVLRGGKVLVLRAKDKIVAQVGHGDRVQVSYNGGGYQLVAKSKNVTSRQDDSTLFYPAQIAETIQEPFPGQKPLATRPTPNSTPSPTASAPAT